MAELHDLSPPEGSTKVAKRKGRGPGSGNGKTAGRGQKGQKARSGGQIHPMFEGGQMPLHRRIPKRGFNNINRVEYQIVNVRSLDRFEGIVTVETLHEAGLISSLRKPVKILGEGDLDKALEVEAHAFSEGAKQKIESAGGSVSLAGAPDA